MNQFNNELDSPEVRQAAIQILAGIMANPKMVFFDHGVCQYRIDGGSDEAAAFAWHMARKLVETQKTQLA